MDTLYEKVLTNNLSDNDKKQLQLVFEKYHKCIQKYQDKINEVKDTVCKSYKSKLENTVQEITTKKKVGRPKIHTDEETAQIKREIAKKHYLNNIEKRKEQKRLWQEKNRELINTRARYYNNKKKLEKSLILEPL
jgi:post-segregation antitoxin (ccd killing protein)